MSPVRSLLELHLGKELLAGVRANEHGNNTLSSEKNITGNCARGNWLERSVIEDEDLNFDYSVRRSQLDQIQLDVRGGTHVRKAERCADDLQLLAVRSHISEASNKFLPFR